MEPYLDQISADDATAGDIVINNANPHTGILLEKWNGADTQVINCIDKNPPSVCEGSYSSMFGNSSPSTGFFRAKK